MMSIEQGNIELVLIITAMMMMIRVMLSWFTAMMSIDQGHVELAISKPKGAGCETPTSEPGFSITDQVLW